MDVIGIAFVGSGLQSQIMMKLFCLVCSSQSPLDNDE